MNGTENGSVGEPITVHNFSEKILEQVVHFHVMKLNSGFFLWVGSNPELSNLALSMCSKYVNKPTYYSELSFIVNIKQKPLVCRVQCPSLCVCARAGFSTFVNLSHRGSVQHCSERLGTKIR